MALERVKAEDRCSREPFLQFCGNAFSMLLAETCLGLQYKGTTWLFPWQLFTSTILRTYCCRQHISIDTVLGRGRMNITRTATISHHMYIAYLVMICRRLSLTLRLIMSYIYGASSKARNANVVCIWTYVWQRWNSLFLFAAQCFNTESMQRGFLCHICV